MHQTDPIDLILSAPARSAAEAEANRERVRARNDLMTANLGLVHHWAGRFSGRGVDREDLVGVGTLGLLRAAELFDESRGPFAAYATTWIKATMGRALDVARAGSSAAGGEASEADDVVDPGAVDPAEALAVAELGARVRDAVGMLPANQAAVIAGRFGLDGDGGRTLAEVAARLGVSKQRAHQVELAALGRLRAMMGGVTRITTPPDSSDEGGRLAPPSFCDTVSLFVSSRIKAGT